MQPFEEIKQILTFLGRENDIEGTLRDKHITKILDYMITTNNEEYQQTLSKLAFKCGINQRYIKENYLLGMEAFGIIKVYSNGGSKHWNWVGIPIEIKVIEKAMCEQCGLKIPSNECNRINCKNVIKNES